jgi:pimeloyl-ACP methyl ester carboxylesterase
MPALDRPSAFTSDRARDRFVSVYDRVLGELWPVPVDAHDVDTRAGSVRIYRAGPTAGDPVVLLSGAGGNALAWYRYVQPLGQARPVVAVDPLGEAGRSVQTQPMTTGAEVGGWLTDVLTALGAERAHLVGSSFGGWTAVEQQLGGGGRVSALTLVDPAGFAPLSARFYRWVILGGMAGLLPRGLRHRAAQWLDNGTLREDALMELGLAGRTFRRRLPTPPGYTDGQLQAVQVPVQVLLGARSAMHDAHAVAARLAAVVPAWSVEIVPETGHALPIEVPELVIDRVLTFADPGQPRAADPGQPRAAEPPAANRP